jgi:hypothetical protein
MSRICRPEHGLELRAVPALARGDHDRQRFLPLLAPGGSACRSLFSPGD